MYVFSVFAMRWRNSTRRPAESCLSEIDHGPTTDRVIDQFRFSKRPTTFTRSFLGFISFGRHLSTCSNQNEANDFIP